ncbi:MAG: OadG family protein [Clostridia bacterium]|nr:OadG family protein [Clostridia bacterium]
MFENLTAMTNIQKGFFLMGVGIAGVFLVLIVFFFLIKLLTKVFPEKDNPQEET